MTNPTLVNYQFPELPIPERLLALVGEAPGSEEVKELQPFVGRSGLLLNDHLKTAGIERSRCLVANVFRVQPPDNNVGYFFASRARSRRLGVELLEHMGRFGGLGYCLAIFSSEIAALQQALIALNPQVIIALGRTPLWALTGLDGILKCRGEVQTCRMLPGAQVIPTYHPSYLLRGNRRLEPMFQSDLALAASLIRQSP
ncbi:MAG: uracil-DNA glycosylase [Rhodospirillaceae bacterium]